MQTTVCWILFALSLIAIKLMKAYKPFLSYRFGNTVSACRVVYHNRRGLCCSCDWLREKRWLGELLSPIFFSLYSGVYGDQVNEMSWAVGQVLDIERETLAMFISDHGPHIEIGNEGGSSGPFRGRLLCSRTISSAHAVVHNMPLAI
jgi:hypothetical protein